VGALKGVFLGICPGAAIVDISHQVEPYQIGQGAYLVEQAYSCFPRGTVHVAVVDPGVGSERRAILVQAGGQFFVGPDNGVFAGVIGREKHRVRHITASRFFRHPVGNTFHGRDIFAPVAAHIAAGVPAASVGKTIADFVRPDWNAQRPRVLHIDRFGNVVTSLKAPDYRNAPLTLSIGGRKISRRARAYADAPEGLFLIEGSAGYIEVSMNRASAAGRLGCRPGQEVRIARGALVTAR
jgi:S-adenosyl-L-methionine hydrolase (adenosine-forming)